MTRYDNVEEAKLDLPIPQKAIEGGEKREKREKRVRESDQRRNHGY